MKKIISKSLVLLPIVFTACTSVPAVKNESETVSPSNHSEKEITPENTKDTQFIKSLENVSLKITSTPKATVTGNAFNTAFSVTVTGKDGTPLAAYPVTVSYPSSKTEGKITFATTELISDQNGLCTFTAEKPEFACSEKITFYPTPVSDSKEVLAAVEKKAVSAEWKVKSDITKKGAVLFIWEFNERGRPTGNSYGVLSKLKGWGIWNVGNAPVNEPGDIGKPLATLYKENYEIIEDQYGYLICGTIKFSQAVTALESGNGYCCTMVADISAVNMKNGKVVYTNSYEQYAEGTNWNNVTQTCKDKLSTTIADSLIFGL